MDSVFCFELFDKDRNRCCFRNGGLSGMVDLNLLMKDGSLLFFAKGQVLKEEYEQGFKLDELFIKFTVHHEKSPGALTEFAGGNSKRIYYLFPLYLYQPEAGREAIGKTPNLNPAVFQKIAADLCLSFLSDKKTGSNVCFANSEELRPEYKLNFTPMDILDYVLAILFSTIF